MLISAWNLITLLDILPLCLLFCNRQTQKKSFSQAEFNNEDTFHSLLTCFYCSLNCLRHWTRETSHCCLSPIFSPKPKAAKGPLNELFSLLWSCGLRLPGQMKSTYLLAAGHMCWRAGSALRFSIFFNFLLLSFGISAAFVTAGCFAFICHSLCEWTTFITSCG